MKMDAKEVTMKTDSNRARRRAEMKPLPGPRRHRGPQMRSRSLQQGRLRARPRLPPLEQGRKREPRRRIHGRRTEESAEDSFKDLVKKPGTLGRSSGRAAER